jgi:hypothetical protein
MNGTTTLRELKTELEKVMETLDKAIQNQQIAGIEKDIALERLRKIYDGIQWLDFPSAEASTVQTLDFSFPESNITEQEVHTTVEELIEKPFQNLIPPAIDRAIIDSLYGDSPLPCKKEEPAAVKPEAEPDPEEIKPLANEEPAPQADEQEQQPGKTLHDTLATPAGRDIASMLSAQANGKLSHALGLNDRLMLLNDLFEMDPDRLDQTMDALDEFDNIEDAYIYLYEHFTMDDSKDGVKLLISLLESKYS